ncbi:MAG TPA: tRNA (N(6)-L-threonylcarbamoyladenosine(37)-C(2))-methylthiotransferase MtaB [Clostridia bacterium]|nr:tRNA (N(6)-L-threonylcarbamoyladenosine(37)-C(2))-methylthiotransferase MtaB [Clostridia bacterium]
MKVIVFSLGCKVNQYECDALVAQLLERGYSVSEKLEYGDVYILNTCAVTAEAERKSRQGITRILNINANAKILVCGCASENNAEPFSAREQVLYVGGTANKMAICDMVDKIEAKNPEHIVSTALNVNNTKLNINNTTNVNSTIQNKNDTILNINAPNQQLNNKIDVKEIGNSFEDMGISQSPRTRHYVKVQDGCNNFCSYCLIPYVRGRSRSRSLDSILEEIEFASKHTKEIVLTGINLSAYGRDNNSSLKDLLIAIKGTNIRIRLGSLEVGVINKDLLEASKELQGFCDHFHLSLQSGDDGVLKSMNRHYNTIEFISAVKLIREYYPTAAITTDIIVGFPTEDDKAFDNTLKFAKDIGFADIHIFSYSPRKRTVAYKLPQIDNKIIEKRHKELEAVKFELRNSYNSSFLNIPLDVLFESKHNGYFVGHTKNYISVYREDAKRGEISTVVCTELFKEGIK